MTDPLKHGIFEREYTTENIYDCFWLGERVHQNEFNDRLAGMTRSARKDLDWMAIGMDLKSKVNEGEKVVAQIDAIEEILKLPLCGACRKLVGEK